MAANTNSMASAGWLTLEARKGKKKKKKGGGLVLLLFAGLGAAALLGASRNGDGDGDGTGGTGWTKADSDAHGGALGPESGCVKPRSNDCIPLDDPALGTTWEIADLPEIKDVRDQYFLYERGKPAIVKAWGDIILVRWRVKNVGDVAGVASMGWGNCYQSFCASLYNGKRKVQPGQEGWVTHTRSINSADLGTGFLSKGIIFLRLSDCNGVHTQPIFGIAPSFVPPGSLPMEVDLAWEHPELFAPKIDGRIDSVLVSQSTAPSIIRGRQEGFNAAFAQGFEHGTGLPGRQVSGGSGGILHGMVDRNR